MGSILNDCEAVDVTNFSGPNLLLDEEDVTEPQGLAARNIEFVEGQVRTRRGFKEFWNPNRIITTLYSWVQEQANRLLYFDSTGVVVSRDLDTSTDTTLLTGLYNGGTPGLPNAVAMTCVQMGYRIFMAFFRGTGTNPGAIAGMQCQVWDGTSTAGVPNVDAAFHRPLTYLDAAADISAAWFSPAVISAAGAVTPGVHAFALVTTSWSGYQGAPGPIQIPGGPLTFSPTFVTVNSTGQKVTITVSPRTTWPSWVQSIQLAATPDITAALGAGVTSAGYNNLGFHWYLITGQTVTVSRGSATPAVFTFSLSDVSLGGTQIEITNTLFNLWFQNGNTPALGPFNPHFICAYNNRNVYLTRTLGPDGISLVGTIVISERFQPQYVTQAYHAVNLPEFRDVITAFPLGGTLNVLGDSWTYAWSDNTQQPVSWASPRLVSGTIGTPWIRGAAYNLTSGYGWVADHNGLYYFDGTNYTTVPASYEQTPDWNRINMAASKTNMDILEVVDDSVNRLVLVKAPLDGAVVATHLLVWDYTNGVAPGQIKYCGTWCIGPDATAVSSPVYAFGAITIVQNPTTLIKELWISRKDSAGDVMRFKSIEGGDATTANPTALYDDNGVGIDSMDEELIVCQAANGPCQQVAAEIRERGGGQINITAISFDQQNPTVLAPILASENSLAPGKRWLRFYDKQSEALSIKLDNGAQPGAFFYWAAIRCYYKAWMRQR